MSNKQVLWRALAALILVGLLVAGGLAVHYVGWSEGYAAGQLAAEGEEGAIAPYGPYGLRFSGRPSVFAPLLFGAGAILRIGLLLLLLVVAVKLFRFALWGIAGFPMMAGHWFRHWRHPHWHRHGPVPPGFREWYGWPEKEAGRPESGGQTDEATA